MDAIPEVQNQHNPRIPADRIADSRERTPAAFTEMVDVLIPLPRIALAKKGRSRRRPAHAAEPRASRHARPNGGTAPGDPYWTLSGLDIWTGSSDPGAAGLLPGSVAQPSPPHEPAASLAPETLASVVNAAREYWAASGLTAGQLAGSCTTRRSALRISRRAALWAWRRPKASGSTTMERDGAGQLSVVSCQWAVGSGGTVGFRRRTTDN